MTEEGFATAGDLGRLDADGYLYIADRRVDMVVSGGANVFPAEVEAALSEHPGVADVVVIGLPDPEWGHRVHAIIEPEDPGHPLREASGASPRSGWPAYKVPKTVEFVESIPPECRHQGQPGPTGGRPGGSAGRAGPQRLRITTLALAPRPMVWARPTRAPGTWRAPASIGAGAPPRPPGPAPTHRAARLWTAVRR